MKLALLSDIHANSLALSVVLDAAKAKGVTELLVAGDLVGYYFSPKEVIDLLASWHAHIVRGNHEEMLSQSIDNPEYLEEVSRRYGSGIQEAIIQLSTVELDFLCTLPHPLELEIAGRNILLCHGAPHDLNCYLYPDNDLKQLDLSGLRRFDLVVTGHTHYSMQRIIGDATLLVNPGSVGQPRNRQPGAHWMLYDTDTGEITLHCEAYDYSLIQAEARKRHPELPYLADVLGRK